MSNLLIRHGSHSGRNGQGSQLTKGNRNRRSWAGKGSPGPFPGVSWCNPKRGDAHPTSASGSISRFAAKRRPDVQPSKKAVAI
jgi:hypothetical protein